MDSAVDFVSTRDTSTSSGSLEFEVVSFPACNNKLTIHIHHSPFSVARNQCHTLYLESGLCIGPFYAKVCYSSHLIGVFIMEEVFASNEPLRVRSLRPASIILLYERYPSFHHLLVFCRWAFQAEKSNKGSGMIPETSPGQMVCFFSSSISFSFDCPLLQTLRVLDQIISQNLAGTRQRAWVPPGRAGLHISVCHRSSTC